jgi:serine phosphatase RsbU (regulator of sigma subunit)
MYTDGIVEATNGKGEEFGISRLERVLQKPSVSARSILADVQQFAHGAALADDATAVVLRH